MLTGAADMSKLCWVMGQTSRVWRENESRSAMSTLGPLDVLFRGESLIHTYDARASIVLNGIDSFDLRSIECQASFELRKKVKPHEET
jgi:hypothetical protein